MRRLTLTTRLTALFTLSSALVLLGFGWITMNAIQRHFEDLDRSTLQDKIRLIREVGAEARSPDELSRRLADVLRSQKDLYVRVQSVDAVLYASTDMALPPAWSDWPISKDAQPLLTWKDQGRTYRGARSTMPSPYASGRTLDVWAMLDTQHHMHFMTELSQTLLLYFIVAALLSGILGWCSARSGLRPLHDMKSHARSITVHRLGERMSVESVPVEMADLAETLNQMLQRLQSDFRRLSEFSSDLAHELRTPISNMLTVTQVELSQPRTVAQYQEVLASNSEELQRLARIVSDMLLLATTEHGLTLPTQERIRLEGEVLALFDFYDALAQDKRIALSLAGEGEIEGDQLMVRRAISNLLSNALRHTPQNGGIAVEIDRAHDLTTVHVTNTGATVTADLLPRLFDRFFRADGARVNPTCVGAGLGLSITRAIMRAHGGRATVTSANGLTRFSLSFPNFQSQRPSPGAVSDDEGA